MMRNKNFIRLEISLFFIFLLFISIAYSQTSEEALKKYNDASAKIEELESKGYPTLPLYDLLDDAKNKYNQGNYEGSISSSDEIFQIADESVTLRGNILKYSSQIEILEGLGVDVSSMDLEMLYIKADYEVANFDLAKESLVQIKNKIDRVLMNYSGELLDELESLNEFIVEKNISILFYENYYDEQIQNYERKNYDEFLLNHAIFQDLKEIITLNFTINKELSKFEDMGVDTSRITDQRDYSTSLLYGLDVDGSLDAIKKANQDLELAIQINTKMSNFESEYERLNDLEILDNSTKRLYESCKSEFLLGNFNESYELMQESLDEFSRLERENIIFRGISKASLKKNLKEFILDNWPFILVLVIIILISYRPSVNFVSLKKKRKLLKNLEMKHELTITTQKELQKNYYFDKLIDKKDFKEEFERNEEEKIELSNLISLIKENIENLDEYFHELKSDFDHFFKKSKDKSVNKEILLQK
ncbi:hypothetical protein C0585_05895 [Candidatus Woesearchaeota archaeon]|nr:MAG: hypothetical protein C0585_05895 [Candidatus Woesearchaeota archaeon]